MRILQVIHDFLPNHQAGSELYCYHLSKTLQRMGHDVKLCFTEIDHERPSYSTREDTYNGLPFLEIVNNHSYTGFEETYCNPKVENIFEQVLTTFQPDAVHFHHALGLSFGCARLCREQRIPVVFTLHDYWLTCPRGGGQRFRGIGKVCQEVDTSLCAECISRFSFPARAGQRLMKKILNRFDQKEDSTLIPSLLRGKIDTPQKQFVAKGVCDIGGDARDVVFAHPPASILIKTTIQTNSSLVFSYAMDPATYTKTGDGVRFEIVCDGDTVFEKRLQPKENEKDQGWHQASIPLQEYAGENKTLAFKTQAYPNGKIDYTSACWAAPRLVRENGETYQPAKSSRILSLTERFLTALQRRGLHKQVNSRTHAALKLFEDVSLFIAPSKFLRSKFIEYGMPEEKIVFSDYGIAPLQETVPPRKPTLPLHFTFVGTVVEHKGLHVLVEAFNRLSPEDATLDIYGALDEFLGYAANVKSMLAHPGIHLRGRAENDEITGILANTDALIVPSIWFENSPITIHEAFLAKVPVITSNFGGMADLVQDGKNGLLFEMGNAQDLVRCLQKVIHNPAYLDEIRPQPESVKSLDEDGEWMVKQYQRLAEMI